MGQIWSSMLTPLFICVCLSCSRFEIPAIDQECDGIRASVTLWNAACHEDCSRVRPLTYPGVGSCLPTSGLRESLANLCLCHLFPHRRTSFYCALQWTTWTHLSTSPPNGYPRSRGTAPKHHTFSWEPKQIPGPATRVALSPNPLWAGQWGKSWPEKSRRRGTSNVPYSKWWALKRWLERGYERSSAPNLNAPFNDVLMSNRAHRWYI